MLHENYAAIWWCKCYKFNGVIKYKFVLVTQATCPSGRGLFLTTDPVMVPSEWCSFLQTSNFNISLHHISGYRPYKYAHGATFNLNTDFYIICIFILPHQQITDKSNTAHYHILKNNSTISHRFHWKKPRFICSGNIYLTASSAAYKTWYDIC